MRNLKQKYKLVFLPLIGLFLLTGSCSELQEGKSLKLAHGLNIDHPVHQGMLFMAKRLVEKSNGKLRIEIYPSSQLGGERQCLELLQIGSLAMTKVSAAVMENFSPKIQVLGLPYMFRNRAHTYAVLDGQIGQELLEDSERYWLRGLAYFDAGYRSFYTKERPIHSPDDLEGLKIRVMESPVSMNLVRSLGGSPTPISWGELYTALQQGVVDGAENNPPSFYTSRHYEICKYYSLNEHTAVPDILVVGKVAWQSLSQEEQQWLMEAAYEATIEQRKLWQAAEKEALAKVQKQGVEIIRPGKEAFFEKTEAMLESYQDRPELYKLIQRIQAVNPDSLQPQDHEAKD
ncbi:MAG: TRAP transporter substrate-binding protein [Bacteroidota bacterium]